VVFTRTLSELLAEKDIRVNGVAPGPIWTPLIPASFPEEKVSKLGSNEPPARSGEPDEVTPLLCFSRLGDSSFTAGQFLHPNGGEVVNGQMLKH
jgi:NAD(P)-dependent dehydrogenase (short-subunit alcohol dehydrogenase family)